MDKNQSKGTTGSLCRACMEAKETAAHVLLNCSAVTTSRAKYEIVNVKRLLAFFGQLGWIEQFSSRPDANTPSVVDLRKTVCPTTQGERELVEFLAEEIVAERKAQKVMVLPKELAGFVVCGDGAEAVMSKQLKDEL